MSLVCYNLPTVNCHQKLPHKNLAYAVLSIVTTAVFVVVLTSVISAKDKCETLPESQILPCLQNLWQSYTQKLTDVLTQKDAVAAKIAALGTQLNVTQAQMDSVTADINKIQTELDQLNKNLQDRHAKLADKITLRNQLIRNYSKNLQMNSVELFLSKTVDNFGLSGFELSYISSAFNKAANSEFIRIIQGLDAEIQGFESDKAQAEQIQSDLTAQKNKLVALKADLANKKTQAANNLQDLSKQAESYTQKLADLTAKQQAIINEKNGEGYGTVGNYSSPAAVTPNPPFKPAFAAFSYGAYTHYNGMSQYGAKGRADAGQDYKKILKFYYGVGVTTASNFPKTISVQGVGTVSFQYYLYGIAEMPSNWPNDALKAQAIAARTFAYRSGKPICTTDACQVFSKSKADNPPSAWQQAVDDTKNVILDNPSTSQYSSTTGGYINNVGWDTNGNWPDAAYEKAAGSPWFYKAWYTQGYNSTNSCGHPHPWLSPEEMADILNSWVVWSKGSSSDKGHVSPTTKSCWGGDPYSLDEMASKADQYGNKYLEVTKISVDISNGGYTSKVTLETDNGTVTIAGDEFKTVFNLRAPGYVSIKSKLYDFEKRN